jgi:hypothetical protein
MKTLAPGLSTVWTVLDVAICRYAVLKPFHYLAESTLLLLVNLVLGVFITTGYGGNRSYSIRG